MKTNQSKLLDLLADDGTTKTAPVSVAAETEKHIEEIEQRLTEKLDKIINNTSNSVTDTPAETNETTPTETNQIDTESIETETETN